MTSPHDYPRPVRRAWAGHETFRRLGFAADDIYVETVPSVNAGGKMGLHSILKVQQLQFVIICGVYDSVEESRGDFELFREFRDHFMAGRFSEEALNLILNEALDEWGRHAMVAALIEKGFKIPGRKP